MSTKDLFNKNNKTLTKSQADKAKKDLESDELVTEVVKSNTRFLSHINYSKPGNFAIYGSAEKYYEDSFDRVYKTYPYDGSHKEKQEWLNNSSELDLWVLDNIYPKSVGHVRLGTGQSIFVKGGPNNQPGVEETDPEELSKQFPVKQGNSNIWNPSVYRNSNLHLDPNLGFTVEFWMKFDDPELPNITPFVIGNIGIGNNDKKKVEVSSLGNNSGMLSIIINDDALTGGTQFNAMAMHNFFETTWNHYSFSFINSDDKVKTDIYKNGVLLKSFVNGTSLGAISQEELYLNINGSMSSVTGGRSNVIDGMYIDEFRFWKQKRTAEETGRYWNTNIHGGTNTDDDKYSEENRNVDIGIYYKFNEGITGDDTIDATVLDYSGRISNGTITNYSNTVRSTTSALDEYGQFILPEEKDYIIYPTHPDFVSSRTAYKRKGMVHDLSNNSSIYHTMPAWITEEDEHKGSNIKELSQVISSYFDNAHVQIRELTNLKEKEYYSLDNETEKPFYLIRNNLKSQGMVVPDLFTEASAFEEILSRSETALFEERLQDVKNTIYQNIYNNLSYIYKSKGTEKAFRNLIRCFGVDDELIKINMYSDGADYTLEDTRRPTAIKKKFVDFNDNDRSGALVYTKEDQSNSESISYIRGVSKRYPANLSFTLETQVIFPKRIPRDHPNYEPPSNPEEQIVLLGEYISYTNTSQNSIFNLKAVKKNNFAESEDVKFELDFDGTSVSTKLFKSVYDNAKFNFAVRLVPNNRLSTLVGTTASSPNYTAELYCVRMLGDTIEDEDTQTLSVSNVDARRILEMKKFVSIGALKNLNNPQTSTTINNTRVKIGSTLFWYDNVTNEEVRAHASDASNFGRLHPSEEAYAFDGEFNTDNSSAIQVLRRDTLAMHWDFSEVSTSDANGEFIVNDLSESLEKVETPVSQNSIQFTGANAETIDIPDSDDLSFTDGNGTDKPFSISSWVKVDDITTDSGVIISRRNNVGVGIEDGEWIIGHSNGELYVILYADPIQNGHVDQNGQPAFSTVNRIFFQDAVTKLTSGTWHFITVTYDGTQNTSGLKVYKDGVQVTTGSTSKNLYSGMPNFNIVTTIGGTDGPVGNTFEDNIADTAVFDKALSSAEIIELYNGGSVKDLEEFSASDNIISWWKMGDDQDATGAGGIKDYIGTNNGTIVGASIQPAPTLSSDNRVDSGRFGWFTGLVGYEVTGLGNHFFPNDNQAVNREFIYSQKHRTPEVINSEDLVEIRTQDDDVFTKDAKVASHFFAVEKSMYQVISDDMINLFATIVEFNDLIGQPVNRYRPEYKALEKFRQRYFEKVKNVPSLEKYTELYKWIDSSIGMMLQELIPVSSNFSADLRNMVESHVLERNKYWTKFPTMEMSGEPPLGIVKGVNELTYNWEHGHAPVGSETIEDNKFLYGDQRVTVATGDTDVDENREILRRVATRKTQGNTKVVERNGIDVEEDKPVLREPPPAPNTPGATYSGQAYVTRALSRPYRLNLDVAKTIHGGVNYSPSTKDPNSFVRAVTRFIPGADTVGIDIDIINNPVTYEQWKELYTVKRSVTVTIADTETNITQNFDDDVFYPYYGEDFRDASPFITGHHNDSYGDDAEIPVQGPFTETWVGGNQHRHVHFNTQAADRPELYIDDSGILKHPQEVDFNNPSARYTRDEVAKRPVNVKNIKSTGDKLIGNYARDYEVVQTSSRSKNNRYFVRNEGITDTLTVAPIQDAQDFTLPDRGRTEHVIVERFSAPGDPLTLSRGYLDRIAEEFSVYNSVNYRNLDDRESNTADLSAHSALYEGSQGYMPDTNGMPSTHKINRNTSHEARGKNHDNAFVSYQIPRSDFQYNVEMLSPERFTYDDTTTENLPHQLPGNVDGEPAGAGYNFKIIELEDANNNLIPIHSKVQISFDASDVGHSNSPDENLYFQYKLGTGDWTTEEIFEDGSGKTTHTTEIDLGQSVHSPLYLRWIARKLTNAGSGDWDITNILIEPTSLHQYLEEVDIAKGRNDYADYQGAGYRFIKSGEKPQVLRNRRNNIISQIDRTRSELAPRTTTEYVEPVVTWNKPNTHYILNERYDGIVRTEPSEATSAVESPEGRRARQFNIKANSNPITYSYSNNLENFANFDLIEAVDMIKEREGQFIDSLMEVFKAGDLLFHRSIAREIIYPRHKNVGLKKIRTRSEFDNYKFFWKDKMLERIKCSDTTKLGYTLTEEFREYFNQKYSVDVMDSFHYKATGTVTTPIFSIDNMSFLTVPDDDSLSFINGNQVDVPFSFSIDLRLINDFANPTSAGGELIYLAAKGTAQTGNIEYIIALTNNNAQVGGPIEYTVQVILLDTNNGGVQLLFGIPGVDFISTSQQYVNIALTYDGSETVDGISVYANGNRFSSTYTVAPGYQGMSNLSADLIIGGRFDGSLKNAVFYNKELTPEEVSRVYAGEVLDSAISRWKIDGNGDDSIGSNDGTLSATDLTTNNPVDFQFVTSDLTTRVIGDLTYMGEDRARHMVTRKDVEPLHTLPAIPLDVACPPLSTSESVVAFYQTADSEYNPPVPTTQLYHNPYNDNYRESEGWINRKSVVAEQKPTYNDYNSYSEEIKLAAQNYGLVSEFRISEHMDKYILENGGNFRAKNYDFLTIDGASYDGVSHTLTSGDSTVETSSFYSTAFEDDSLIVTSYPTTGSQATLVTNNSEGYADINPIYSPNFAAKFTSTFDLTNSINTNITENAAGKFNLEATDEDYLMVTIDNWDLESDTDKRISLKDPFTISVWAQPEDKDTQDYQVLFANTNMETSGFDENFVLYSRFKLPDSAFQYLGLTLAVTQSINDIDSTSQGIFAFFNRDRTPARLKSQSFNHVALQFVPPNTRDTSVNPEQNPFLVKLWLNGEELYGIPVSTLINSYSTGYGVGDYGVRGYSPCQVGFFKGNPWSDPVSSNIVLYEDVTFEDGYRIGIGGHSSEANRSLKDISLGMITHNFEGASTTQKFKGLLDELCVFRGLLSKVSIQNIYNEGVPPDVNELMDGGSIGDSFSYLTEIPGFFGFPAIPMFADSGEFDFGVEAGNLDDAKIEINNFQSTANSAFPSGNWVNTSGGNAVKESVVAGNTNKLLALTGAVRAGTNADPDAADFYREVRYNFANPKQHVTVNFRVYEGVDSTGDYTLTNAPEPDSDNHLYFQYSADGTTWTTAKTIEAGNGVQANRPYWDLSQVVTCVFEAASIEHVRWISRIESNSSTLDHWGIDDVVIYDHDDIPDSDEKSIMVRVGNDPAVPFLDFSNNYTPNYQLNLETTLPVWHRIGVPSYNKVTKAEDWDDDFFDSYVHTDNINFIEKSNHAQDSLGLDSKNSVSLKVNAIKKLLPYEGFYPQDRTVQIANLFKEKLTGNILHGDKSTEEHGIQAALQHFFAPGILYNSIKAGVACDWASYTNASGLNSSYHGEPIRRFSANGEPRVHYNHAFAPEWYTGQDGFDGTLIQSQYLGIGESDANQFEASVAMKSSNFNSYDSVSGDFDVDHIVKNLVITKSPTERLPFEALLNPFDYLLSGETELVAQNDGLQIEAKPNQYFYMSPSDYRDILTYNVTNNNTAGTIVSENITKYQYPYFEIKQNRNDDFRYELAINNFIAESTKFFIEGEELSSFASSPQKDGFSLVSGSTYYMDVIMEKTEDFAPVNSRKFLGGRYFGPPVRWFDNDTEKYNYAGEHDKISDTAFAPYVPPYFYASCVNRISFTADTTRKHSLKEIQNGCVVTPVTNGIDNYFRDAALSVVEIQPTSGEAENSITQKEFKNSVAYTSRMSLSASLELFGTTSLGKREFDPLGNIRSIASADTSEQDAWVIYSKFECPLFDFSSIVNDNKQTTLNANNLGQSPVSSETTTVDGMTYEFFNVKPDGESTLINSKTGSGIWAGFGEQTDASGVTVSIRESFPKGVSATTGSLLQVCGFNAETRQLGRVASQKKISEAVVMIPFLERPLRTALVPGISGNREVLGTVEVDGRNLIKVPRNVVVSQISKKKLGQPIYSVFGEEVLDTSITNMMEGMRKYNIPPLYDFRTFNEQPFVMYFFEFNHTLDKEDLSNIWQGLQPKIAKQASLDSVEVSHDINENELFGAIGEIPEGIRWMVFKVKQKAEKSYFNLTEDSRDDKRFKFKFDVGAKEPEYGYNYPYDYFTILEMIQVEANSEKEIDPHEQYKRTTEGEEE